MKNENPYKSPESDPDEPLLQPIYDWFRYSEIWENFLNTLPLTVMSGIVAFGGWGLSLWPLWAVFVIWPVYWIAVFVFMYIMFFIAMYFG
jgi:hypothetical protein